MASQTLFDLPARLQQKIMPEPNSGCWIWTGARAGKNYGVTSFEGRQKYAHAVVYFLLVGKIPKNLESDHLCRLPCCVNPSHIEPVTHAENLRRSGAVSAFKAWAGKITHCPAGHAYIPENTRINKGKRTCRSCQKLRCAEWDAKNRQKRLLAARKYRRKNAE